MRSPTPDHVLGLQKKEHIPFHLGWCASHILFCMLHLYTFLGKRISFPLVLHKQEVCLLLYSNQLSMTDLVIDRFLFHTNLYQWHALHHWYLALEVQFVQYIIVLSYMKVISDLDTRNISCCCSMKGDFCFCVFIIKTIVTLK
jgi:hypothetical protein